IFAIYTSSKDSPTFPNNLSKFFPAAPTNGTPCKSSLRPGASPTKRIDASALPFPNTRFVALPLNGKLVSAIIFCLSSSKRCSFSFMPLPPHHSAGKTETPPQSLFHMPHIVCSHL